MPHDADAVRPHAVVNGKPLSTLGFGCSSFWSKPEFSAERAVEILELCAAQGVSYFDTSPSYAQGEERLAAFLSRHDATDFVISTKVGTLRDGGRSFDPARMRESLDGSLTRLGLPKVDILYLHGPSRADLNDAVFAFFDEQKRAGRIGLAGINSFDLDVVESAITLPIDVVMLQYNVVDQRFEQVMQKLAAAGKTVITGTTLAQGVYGLKTFLPRNRQALWYLLRALRKDPLFAIKGRRLRRKLLQVDSDPHAAALRFVVGHPLIASALFNSTSPAHVTANIAAAARPMTAGDRQILLKA